MLRRLVGPVVPGIFRPLAGVGRRQFRRARLYPGSSGAFAASKAAVARRSAPLAHPERLVGVNHLPFLCLAGASKRKSFSGTHAASLFFSPVSAQSTGRPVLPALHITPLAARHFLRRALGLDTPHPDLVTALAHHGFIQIDPINVCGRMHDLILRNRICDYREGALHAFIHSRARPGFEHYLPGQGILAAFPTEAWPFLTGHMLRRRKLHNPYHGKLTPREAALAGRILAEITMRGPLTSDDIEHHGRARSAWGTSGRLVKQVLEKLFDHGRVLIAARKNFRRVYDLPERVLPATVLAQPPRPEREVAAWLAPTKLRQRRLAWLKRDELALVISQVQPVAVDGADCPPLYCLRTDVPLLAEIQSQGPERENSHPPLLLAPLDPLIYDRRLARAIWNFDYTWEAYTPAARRTRGHYALPILAGIELVGHVDPKADRQSGKLRVVSRRVRRGCRVAPAVKLLASFLGLRS